MSDYKHPMTLRECMEAEEPLTSKTLVENLRGAEFICDKAGLSHTARHCAEAANEIERLEKRHADDQRLLGWQEQHDPRRRVRISSDEPAALPSQLLDVHAICDERDRLRRGIFGLAHKFMNDGRSQESAELGALLNGAAVPPKELIGTEIERDKLRSVLPHDRDVDWILAIAYGIGVDAGFKVPIVPEPEVFRRFFAEIRGTLTKSKWPAVRLCILCGKPSSDDCCETVRELARQRAGEKPAARTTCPHCTGFTDDHVAGCSAERSEKRPDDFHHYADEKTAMPGGKGADATTAATEPVRRPSSAPPVETSAARRTAYVRTTIEGGPCAFCGNKLRDHIAMTDCGVKNACPSVSENTTP